MYRSSERLTDYINGAAGGVLLGAFFMSVVFGLVGGTPAALGERPVSLEGPPARSAPAAAEERAREALRAWAPINETVRFDSMLRE